jgi:hypothetical protein
LNFINNNKKIKLKKLLYTDKFHHHCWFKSRRQGLLEAAATHKS